MISITTSLNINKSLTIKQKSEIKKLRFINKKYNKKTKKWSQKHKCYGKDYKK